MRDNNSYFPADHIHPLQILENMNHPMIPKLVSYNNYSYTCEHIEGISLENYIRKTRDAALGLKIIKDINNFMYDLTEITKVNDKGQVLQFLCDDIHGNNIMVTEDGKVSIIDLDQFGFHHPYTIFKILQFTNIRLCGSVRDGLLIGDSDTYSQDSKDKSKHIKKLEEKLLDYV